MDFSDFGNFRKQDFEFLCQHCAQFGLSDTVALEIFEIIRNGGENGVTLAELQVSFIHEKFCLKFEQISDHLTAGTLETKQYNIGSATNQSKG
jgi:hypothetical protein